ncbi:HAD-IIB family hydrolase [Oscillibacter sp.]|uniref:HAD-IIB family hydrolase n=1 Tax=Oscillibacter sp. TaxID=1945593 RepID=UPI00262E2777|nr:HAD-IIB family hydrolase [Oscillibacter sp.]MDD3347962.1 HAD-IIB family hydrolase [Oscillibacter sp.]
MGRFDGCLLASDFDNTLIYTEGALRTGQPVPPLSARNREALEYFMAEGGRFAVATGRALAAFLHYAEMVPKNAPCVVCNGAALYDFSTNEYLETTTLDDDARRRGQLILEQFPAVAVEAYHIDNVIHAVHPNEVTRQHEHLTKVKVTETPTLLEVPLPLGKLLFEADHAQLEEVCAFLERQGWSEDYELIFSGRTLLEMTARGANKGGMVRRLAARLGISMDHVYCVGDEANDIPMLTAAAEGFAPANCVDAVRACGATVVADATADALADVVARLGEKYR